MVGQHNSFVEYPWSGLSGYNITFPCELDTSGNAKYIAVYLRTGDALTNVTGYTTVSGTVVDFNSYPPGYDTCDAILIRRESPIEQLTDFPSYIQYGDEMENALDKLTLTMAELHDNLTQAYFPRGNALTLQGFSPGNNASDIPISNGAVNTNLNADKLDGYDAGNGTGNIPVSNGTVNTDLNADKLDGYDYSDILDAVVPIGFTYIQLPGMDSPATIWPWATWENISNQFPAQFLRVEGTYDADHVAVAFGGGVQMDTVQPHEHYIESNRPGYSGQTNPGTDWGGVATTTTAGGTYHYYAGAGYNGTIGTETRPLNVTVRVWRRIA